MYFPRRTIDLTFISRVRVIEWSQKIDLKLKTSRVPAQSRAKETLRNINNVTEKLLVHSGFASITMRNVAKEAKVSVGTIYEYFPNKTALIAPLFEQRLQKIENILQRAATKNTKAMTFKHVFDRYESLMIEAHLFSRIDIEMHNIAQHDETLGHIFDQHYRQHTETLAMMLTEYGCTLNSEDTLRLAKFMYELQRSNLRLQHQADIDTRKFFGKLAAENVLQVAKNFGVN